METIFLFSFLVVFIVSIDFTGRRWGGETTHFLLSHSFGGTRNYLAGTGRFGKVSAGFALKFQNLSKLLKTFQGIARNYKQLQQMILNCNE